MQPLLEPAIEPLTDALVAAFLYMLAANIGSFLNVVVHRWPRGGSVIRGGSCCPRCGAAIRWHDNVPVLGWLWLRGRCRDCRAPISPRYPVVEAACAALLGTLASVELLTGGSNLPDARFGGGRWGCDSLLLHTDWRLVAVCLMHCFIVAALLAWAVLEFEGTVVPRSWAVAATLALFVAAGIIPWLQPVAAAFPWCDWPPAEAAWRGGFASLAGIAAGWMLGRRFESQALRSGLVLAAAGLGWQAVVTVAVMTVLVAWGRRLPGMPSLARGQVFRASASDLVLATAAQVLFWKQIHHFWVVAARSLADGS